MSVHYIAIPTDGGEHLAHFGRAHTMVVFGIDTGKVVTREKRVNPDPEHLDPGHHRIMLDLVRGCQVVVATYIGAAMVASLSRLGVQVLASPTELVQGAVDAYVRSLGGATPLEPVAQTAEADPYQYHHSHHRLTTLP